MSNSRSELADERIVLTVKHILCICHTTMHCQQIYNFRNVQVSFLLCYICYSYFIPNVRSTFSPSFLLSTDPVDTLDVTVSPLQWEALCSSLKG